MYERVPLKGSGKHTDSMVTELDFEKDGIEYQIKFHIEVDYSRFYQIGDWEQPGEDNVDILDFRIDIIKGWKYIKNDEIELSEKELGKIKEYMNQNLEIL